MGTPAAIIIGAVIIAATIAVVFRWDVSGTGNGTVRLDRWSGSVTASLPQAVPKSLQAYSLECDAK